MDLKKVMLILVLILVLGTGLRFFHLSQEALWTDEMVSLMHVETGSVYDLTVAVIEKELTPPGHSVLLFYWVKWFGSSEFSLRFTSALVDIGSIFLIFLIGSRLFSRKVGLLSSFICSITMLQIVYAQEARPYALLGFLVLLSSYLFILFYQKKQAKYLVPYAIVTLASLYVGYMTFFVIGFHLLYLLLTKRFSKHYFYSLIAIAFGYITGFQILFYQALKRHPLLQENLVYRGVPQFLSNLGIGFYLLPLLFVTVSVLLLYYLFKKYQYLFVQKRISSIVILITLVVAVLHLVFLNTTLRSFALIRHSFFIVPFCYIILAWAVLCKSKMMQRFIILIIVVFSIFTLSVYYTETTKAPWPDAIEYMQQNSPEGTIALFDRQGSNNELFEYYGGEYFRTVNLIKTDDTIMSQKKLDTVLEKQNKFWLVSSRNIKNKDMNLFGKYDLIISKEYPELTVYLYG